MDIYRIIIIDEMDKLYAIAISNCFDRDENGNAMWVNKLRQTMEGVEVSISFIVDLDQRL